MVLSESNLETIFQIASSWCTMEFAIWTNTSLISRGDVKPDVIFRHSKSNAVLKAKVTSCRPPAGNLGASRRRRRDELRPQITRFVIATINYTISRGDFYLHMWMEIHKHRFCSGFARLNVEPLTMRNVICFYEFLDNFWNL